MDYPVCAAQGDASSTVIPGGVARSGVVCTRQMDGEKGKKGCDKHRCVGNVVDDHYRPTKLFDTMENHYWDDEDSEMEELTIAFGGGGVRQGLLKTKISSAGQCYKMLADTRCG